MRLNFRIGVVVLLIVFSCKSIENNKSKSQPNLLFIFPDQLRNASIGINNQDPVHTPNLDKLGKDGLVFSKAISNYPLCTPYRGMLMTGKLPYNTGLLTNAHSRSYKYNNSWRKDDISFSDVLVKNGYDTGYVGKLHLTAPEPSEKDKDLWLWDAYTPKEERHGFKFWYAYGTFDKHDSPHYWVNNAKENELKQVNQWSPEHEADVIIDYIKNPSEMTREASKPFALFWSINPPHPPYQYVPEKYLEAYEGKKNEDLLVRDNVDLESDANEFDFHPGATRKQSYRAKQHVKNYFAMITGVDDQIGRVLNTLKQENLEDNTIVVITSDHGEMMASHGLMSKNIWFEEALNVPFIIRWPKMIKKNQTNDLLLSVTDIMPTLLSMMGATKGLPNDLDGKDLSSLILKNKGEKPKSVLYYFIEAGNPASGYRGIRTQNYTYVITIDKKNVERKFLYDNLNDPYQLNNVINKGANNDLKIRLHEALISQLTEKKDPWLKNYNTVIQKQTNE